MIISRSPTMSLKKLPVAPVVALGVLSTLLLVISYFSWRQTVYETTPILDQIMEVKVKLMSGHLLYEEMVRGIRNIQLADVRDQVESSHVMTKDSLDGRTYVGQVKGKVPNDLELKGELLSLQLSIHQILDQLQDSRFPDKGLELDRLHDDSFSQAIMRAEAADARVHELVKQSVDQQKMMFAAGLLIWLFSMGLTYFRWRQLAERFDESNARVMKLSHAVEHTGESMLISNRDGVIEYVNDAFTNITGYAPEEVLGKNPSILSSGLQGKGFYKLMWDTILGGEVWRGEVTDKRKDGSCYQAMMSISPILDDQGELTHFVAVQRDISELRTLEKNLIQAKKMDAVGTLSCGLAHDLNNSMTAILGSIELARMDNASYEDMKMYLYNAEKAGAIAVGIIKELMLFARKENIHLTHTDINEVVYQSLTAMQLKCAGVKLESFLPESPLFIQGNHLHLHRMITNLLSNACDAADGSDVPKILVSLAILSQKDAGKINERKAANSSKWVRLAVGDNGCGIESELIDKIFDPFFTTKAVGKGTGLGLSCVYGVVEGHHGFIQVDSEKGKGTTFNLYFPSV